MLLPFLRAIAQHSSKADAIPRLRTSNSVGITAEATRAYNSREVKRLLQ